MWSPSTDWLREGVPRGRVPVPEPSALHPAALALRRRPGLHGPQRRGELRPRCKASVWPFILQTHPGHLEVEKGQIRADWTCSRDLEVTSSHNLLSPPPPSFAVRRLLLPGRRVHLQQHAVQAAHVGVRRQGRLRRQL